MIVVIIYLVIVEILNFIAAIDCGVIDREDLFCILFFPITILVIIERKIKNAFMK